MVFNIVMGQNLEYRDAPSEHAIGKLLFFVILFTSI